MQEGDAAILASLADLERIALAAYEAAVAAGGFGEDLTNSLEIFRDQMTEHADALEVSLEALGGRRPEKPADLATLDRRLADRDIDRRLEGASDPDELLETLLAIETALVRGYHASIQRLQDAKLLQTAVSIMANEGQHLLVLREALGRPATPSAFEPATG